MKKTIKAPKLWATACVILFLAFTSCQKQFGAGSPNQGDLTGTHLSTLSTIKPQAASSQILVGFYRTYGNHYGSITAMPSVVNVVDLFGSFSSNNFGDSLLNYFMPALHAKGIKVTFTGSLDLPSGAPHNQTGYNQAAAIIMDTINKYGLDGFDIDVESNPSGTQLSDWTGVYNALSSSLGPKSGTGKLLTFDTNQDGSNSLFQNVYADVSYVYFQAYGQGTGNLTSIWNSFSSHISVSQFIPGFSFYEENGYPSNYWNDVTYPENGTGNAYDMARWTTKGGIFEYAIDRDAPLKSQYDNTIYAPNYKVTTDLATILASLGTGGGTGSIVSGATYKIISAVNNSSLLDVTGSGTANGTAVELWSDNSPTTANQEWVVTNLGNGYYNIQPVNAPGSSLDDNAQGTANGTKIQIWTSNSSTAQQWKLTNVSGNYYTMSPACAPSSCVDDQSQGTTNGNKIQLYTANGTVAQEWQFVQQ